MTKNLFSWLNSYSYNLLGSLADWENLMDLPLQTNETLRSDKRGCFYRLKAPDSEACLWNKFIFWFQLHFNKTSLLIAMNDLILLFEQRLKELEISMQAENAPQLERHIECLNSLKNDCGYLYCPEEMLNELMEKLQKLEKKACRLAEKHLQKLLKEEEKAEEKKFLLFLNEAQAILILLTQESVFGLQQARSLLTTYNEDISDRFSERVKSIQGRLLLAQELNQEIENKKAAPDNKGNIPPLCNHLKTLKEQLDHEINNLENEIEILTENLRYMFYYHSCDEIFFLMSDFSKKEKNERPFELNQSISEKIQIIQGQLNQWVA